MPRIILDPAAKSHLLDHLEVIHRPLVQPLCLDDLALADQKFFVFVELRPDRFDRRLDRLLRHHVVRFRVDRQPRFVLCDHLAEQRVDRVNGVDLVTPELDPVRLVLITRIQLDDIAANAKNAAFKIDIHAFVLQFDKLLQKLLAFHLLPRLNEHKHPEIRIRVAKSVNARHRRHDDHVPPLEQRTSRRQPQPVDLFVDSRFFFYVKVGGRNVCFRLVVVVVRDEIFDRVLGEERLEFLIELGGERLIMCQHQRRPLRLLDNVRDRKRFAAARDAEQDLILGAVVDVLD